MEPSDDLGDSIQVDAFKSDHEGSASSARRNTRGGGVEARTVRTPRGGRRKKTALNPFCPTLGPEMVGSLPRSRRKNDTRLPGVVRRSPKPGLGMAWRGREVARSVVVSGE